MLRMSTLACCIAALLFQLAAAEEEEKSSQMAVAIAATLLGAITFQMGLFCLTNHPDLDMRRYTYEVVSATVSIFCAVLLFQSANDLVEAYLLEGTSLAFQAVVDMLHMLFWYGILQLVLAYLSGAIGDPPEDMEQMELNMKSFAVILAHMTGFASINAWGSLQELPFFRSSPWMSFLILPVSAIGQFCLERCTEKIRVKVALADDGETDEFEKAWEEECEDAENDVMGLTLSFNLTQAVRFLISGILPNQEGGESWEELIHGHNRMQMCGLFGVGLSSIVVMVVMYLKKPAEELSEVVSRMLDTLYISLAMVFAWCVFFAFRWTLASISVLHDPMLLAVAVAMMVSLASFSSIRVLDLLSDHLEELAAEDGGKEAGAADAIRHAISGIGILVGFAWEQCFDQAVDCVSSVLPMRHLSKTLLAVAAVGIIGPAWKWWVLPMVVAEGWRFGFVLDHQNEHLREGAVSLIEKHLDNPEVQAKIAAVATVDKPPDEEAEQHTHTRLKKLHDRLAGHFGDKRASRRGSSRKSVHPSAGTPPKQNSPRTPPQPVLTGYSPLPGDVAPPSPAAAQLAPSTPVNGAKGAQVDNCRMQSAIAEALEALRSRDAYAKSRVSVVQQMNSKMESLVSRMASLEAQVGRQ